MDNENTNNQKAGRLRSVIVILGIVAAVAIVLAILWSPVISPALKHLKANKLISEGDYESAYAILHELGDEEAILESEYNRAMKEVNEGKIIEAYETLVALDGYKDSTEQAASLYVKYEIEKIKMAEVGDYVVFGAYDSAFSEKEKIEWQVLAKEDDRLLLISDKALDCQPYNILREEVTWETCSLRKWLNNTFLNAAFNSAEQTKILDTNVSADNNPEYRTDPGNVTTDKVFLLSMNEVNKYFNSEESKKCVPTDYAKAKGASAVVRENCTKNGKGTCTWWLRTPGYTRKYVVTVLPYGGFFSFGFYADEDWFGVRPALWIDLGE